MGGGQEWMMHERLPWLVDSSISGCLWAPTRLLPHSLLNPPVPCSTHPSRVRRLVGLPSSVRFSSSSEPAEWPGALGSPSLYFALRRRQLQMAFRAAAAPSAASAALWYPSSSTKPSQLLQRRGMRAIAVLVPSSKTNVEVGMGWTWAVVGLLAVGAIRKGCTSPTQSPNRKRP